MKRWPVILILPAALGVITTVAIAWACAAWVDPNLIRPALSIREAGNGRREAVSIQSGFGHTRVNRMTCVSGPIEEDGRVVDLGTQFDEHARSESRAGWPFRAFVCGTRKQVTVRHLNGHNQAWDSTAGVDGAAFELTTWPSTYGAATWRAVPYHPLWWGLLADTTLFAALWLAIGQGWLWLRRTRRRRLGLCTRCGYDLRGSATGAGAVCPECGWSRHQQQVTSG